MRGALHIAADFSAGGAERIKSATAAAVFEAYVVRGTHAVSWTDCGMDNLAAHKREGAKELTEARGCELLYLAPHSSPVFNPIEETYAKIKGFLLKAEAQGREALIERIGQAISAVGARGAQNLPEHGGYRAMVQPFGLLLYVVGE